MGAMTISIMTLNIATYSIMTLSTATFSVMSQDSDIQHKDTVAHKGIICDTHHE